MARATVSRVQDLPMSSFIRLSLPLLVVAAAATAAEPTSPTALSKVNVFAPPATAAAAQPEKETIEFAGISSVGKKTELIFIDKSTKPQKNYWIAKGETKEGITVLNYDSKREEAVVKINGAQKTLALRKGGGPVNAVHPVAPMPVGFNVAPTTAPTIAQSPAPVPVIPNINPAASEAAAAAPANKPEAPHTPEAVAKAETEARMLVSDLLEIGMAQRKAYEEQQRKAAEGKTDQPAQPKP
jgi:hypothetical protein